MTDPDRSRPPVRRTAAWVLLAVCTAGNLVLSLYGGALVWHLVLGVATVACLAALVLPRLRSDR